MLARKPSTSAVTKAVPAVVLEVKSTSAMPLALVVTVTLPLPFDLEEAESDPAVVAKMTDVSAIPAPDPFVTWRRITMVLRPSATTAGGPDGVDMARWTTFPVLAGACVVPPPEELQPL